MSLPLVKGEAEVVLLLVALHHQRFRPRPREREAVSAEQFIGLNKVRTQSGSIEQLAQAAHELVDRVSRMPPSSDSVQRCLDGGERLPPHQRVFYDPTICF